MGSRCRLLIGLMSPETDPHNSELTMAGGLSGAQLSFCQQALFVS